MGFDKCQLRVEEGRSAAKPAPRYKGCHGCMYAAAATVAMDGGNEACASTHYIILLLLTRENQKIL
jgi:hypothetical protein